ncbi:NIF3-like protein-like protein [Mycena amicta]|nr:NIF3-like protein-like protein [Mycena amicta]
MAVPSSILTKSVCSAMQRIAPIALAGSWDNVGLILESPVSNASATKNRVLLTIDLTPAVCDEALSIGARMLVSYHPPVFQGLKSLTLSSPLQTSLLRCAAGGISIYTPHSALDSVWGGVNDWLAGIVSGRESDERVLIPDTGRDKGGEGRRVQLEEPVEMSELVSRIKTGLGLSSVQVGYSPLRGDRIVRSIAICDGSGASMFAGLKEAAVVYFTGEMQHVRAILPSISPANPIYLRSLRGHTNTERGYLPILADKLRAELRKEPASEVNISEIEVLVSDADKNPLVVV